MDHGEKPHNSLSRQKQWRTPVLFHFENSADTWLSAPERCNLKSRFHPKKVVN